jgi:rhodanese-related sulfurtransferase
MHLNEIFEISARQLAEKLKTEARFYIIDVRENWEVELARLQDERVLVIPMSKIARERQEAFPAELSDTQAEIIVMCHHGVRSAQVTGWMRQNGWQNVSSLAGGIEAYAQQIDQSVGSY